MEELVCTFVAARHVFGDPTDCTVVGTAETVEGEEVIIKGKMVDAHPKMQCTYRFSGRWQPYVNNRTGLSEQQFVFDGLIEERPLNRAGICRLLAESPGITAMLANLIYEEFGPESIDRILAGERPEVKRLTAEKFSALRGFLKQWQSVRVALIDLMGIFSDSGIRMGIAKKCIDEWGVNASERVRANPFILVALQGVGFATADKLYLKMGRDPNAIERQQAFVQHFLESGGDGSSYLLDSAIETALDGMVGSAMRFEETVDSLEAEQRICQVWTDRALVPNWDGTFRWIASEKDARVERSLARDCQRLAQGHAVWPKVDMETLSQHQQEVLHGCLGSPFCILGGGPGTGKTYCSTTVIKSCIERFGADQVLVCAPTGKAAVRSTEAMSQAGMSHQAMTIHRALKVAFSLESFEHNRKNPLPVRVVVVDEPSMIPASLMASLLEAIADDTLVLMVGDVNQLPPVGRGAPLRDMLRAGVAARMLTEMQRNSGTIVKSCHSIVSSGRMGFDNHFNLEEKQNLVLLPTKATMDEAIGEIRSVQAIVRDQGHDPWYDLQVIVPLNDKGQLARVEFNSRLQQQHMKTEIRSKFYPGNKVICRKNGWCRAWNDPSNAQVYVSNGDQGVVEEVRPKMMVVELSNPTRVVSVPLGSEEGGTWDLAYAITCHNSQGSEYPFCCVISDPAGVRVCSKEWWNTAISRAKVGCFVIGPLQTVEAGLRRTAVNDRVTFLTSRLRGEL